MSRDGGSSAPGLRLIGALVLMLLLALPGSWLTFGCATSSSGRRPGAPDSAKMESWGEVDQADLVYPEQIGSFSLVEVEDFAEVELGVRLKYADSNHPRAVIDAYVYPITKVETLSLTRVLDWEMSSVSASLEHVARKTRFEAGEPESFPSGPSSEDPPRGLGVVRILSSQSKKFVSQAYLVVRDDRFFKLRMAIPRKDLGRESRDYFQEVIDVLQPAIHLRPPVEKPRFALKIYQNVYLAPQHETCNLAGWIAYGTVMLEQIEAGHYRDTFPRELAARKRALEFWRELREGGMPCASDVMEAMSRADEAGFLTEYVFEAYGRKGWTAPDGLRLEAWKGWSRSNIAPHDPVVEPGVVIQWRRVGEDRTPSAPRSTLPTR